MRSYVRGSSFLFGVALIALAAAPASAQVNWGPRGGLSFSPDQIVLGAHVNIPVGSENFALVPSLDIAFGDDLFTIGLHGDLDYRFQVEGSVKPYVGAGFSYYNYDSDAEGADANSETGVNILGGVWLNSDSSTPFFVEGKFGLSDTMPDFKVMAGVNL